MSDKREKKNSLTGGGVTGYIILAAILLVVFALLLFAMYKTGLAEPPAFLAPLFGQTKVEIGDEDMQKLLASLRDREDKEENILSLDDSDFVYSMLSSIVAKSYRISYEVTYSYGASDNTAVYNVVCDGNRYRVDKYAGGELVSSVVCDGKSVKCTDIASGKSGIYGTGDGFTLASASASVSLSDIADILAGAKDGGEYDSRLGHIVKCDASLVQAASSNMICVTVYFDAEGSRYDEYYIDADNGVMLMSESYSGGVCYYTMTADSFSTDLSELNLNSLFEAE